MRFIVEKSKSNVVMMDMFAKLAQSRIVFIDGIITDDLSNAIIAQLLYLDSLDKKEITIYINSYGGSVYDGLAIIDIMKKIKSPIKTVAIGKAMSMGALILLCGDTRTMTANSTIMLHQPSGSAVGTFDAIETNYKEISRLRKIMYEIVKANSKITNPEEAFSKDVYYGAREAIDINIVDEVL